MLDRVADSSDILADRSAHASFEDGYTIKAEIRQGAETEKCNGNRIVMFQLRDNGFVTGFVFGSRGSLSPHE
jgi:hypothetical protein